MHYYEKLDDGAIKPRHFVPMSSRDELRPTRITDVKKMWKEGRLVAPSVTTVLNVLNKAALINWKIEQHLFQAWHWASVNYRVPADYDDAETYIAEIKRLTELEMDKAPSAGSNVHKSLENWAFGMEPEKQHEAIIQNVNNALIEHCGPDGTFEPEVQFVHPDGFGGCADLVYNGWIIDYKTKQTAEKFKPGKMAYQDHAAQLAAYRWGLEMADARCANIFICIESGEVDFHEHDEDQISVAENLFAHALAIWKIQNGWPSELEVAA